MKKELIKRMEYIAEQMGQKTGAFSVDDIPKPLAAIISKETIKRVKDAFATLSAKWRLWTVYMKNDLDHKRATDREIADIYYRLECLENSAA